MLFAKLQFTILTDVVCKITICDTRKCCSQNYDLQYLLMLFAKLQFAILMNVVREITFRDTNVVCKITI